jgi:hypothetical protein
LHSSPFGQQRIRESKPDRLLGIRIAASFRERARVVKFSGGCI